jgi:hypothetical protein
MHDTFSQTLPIVIRWIEVRCQRGGSNIVVLSISTTSYELFHMSNKNLILYYTPPIAKPYIMLNYYNIVIPINIRKSVYSATPINGGEVCLKIGNTK